MDTTDESENNAKISDSVYSNSCSNSQSRRSRSSKSTHSGSHSSGSSGYGGKQSDYSNSDGKPPEKRSKDKDIKKKMSKAELRTATQIECRPPEKAAENEAEIVKSEQVEPVSSPSDEQFEKVTEDMMVSSLEKNSSSDEVESNSPLENANADLSYVTSGRANNSNNAEGFACLISMQDGIVMYASASLTSILCFPKDMWLGRYFIDYIHPRDRDTFASQVTCGLAVPKNANGMQESAPVSGQEEPTMVCRIRRYRDLNTGFSIKTRKLTFMPFMLNLSFKKLEDEEGQAVYLVVQAKPLYSAFRIPNEVLTNASPFVLRHSAKGILEYMDPVSVPYLGYLPRDIKDKDALKMYHPEDLQYLSQVYESIIKEGEVPRCKTYRMMAQNGEFLKLETEWSSFINPWSKKLEFVIGKHYIMEGPSNPDVFQTPEAEKATKECEEKNKEIQAQRENIVRIMNEVLRKPTDAEKQLITKRCQDLALIMENLLEERPKTGEELRLEINDQDNCYDRDSEIMGGISPHHDCDSKSSTETALSYTQLNYNETLQRYFESHEQYSNDDKNTQIGHNVLTIAFPKGECTSTVKISQSSVVVSNAQAGKATSSSHRPSRLTETLLLKHNAEMEKELLKLYRETRSNSKGERESTNESMRKNKKEHLARCNASFQPTLAGVPTIIEETERQGLKRGSNWMDTVTAANKLHCPSNRHPRDKHVTTTASVHASSLAAGQGHAHHVASTNTYILAAGMSQQMSFVKPISTVAAGMSQQMSFVKPMAPVAAGMSQQMSFVRPMATVTGMFPLYYAGTPSVAVPDLQSTSKLTNNQFRPNIVHGMIYGQAVYGQPFMYSPTSLQGSIPMPQIEVTSSEIPQSAMPQLGIPQSEMPQTGMPQSGMPQSGMLQTVMPQSGIPQSGMPQSGMPQPVMPQSVMQQSGILQSGMPQSGMPLSGMPQSGMPQSGMPLSEMPQSGMPLRGMPQSGMPLSGMLQSMILQNAMSQSAIPQIGMTPNDISQTIQNSNSIGLDSSNFEEACKRRSPIKARPRPGSIWRARRQPEARPAECSQIKALHRSTEVVTDSTPSSQSNTKTNVIVNSEDRTDGDSSISSFYSSFFKTDTGTGSAEDSSDLKKAGAKHANSDAMEAYNESVPPKKMARRKMDPPWMDQVCVTSDLIYKYQVATKSLAEVLEEDKKKLSTFDQPALVNEQLSQLYMNLQIEGMAEQLTLDEGISSSSSSGEEYQTKITAKDEFRRREYSKLVMIYEEDAPLPSPSDGELLAPVIQE